MCPPMQQDSGTTTLIYGSPAAAASCDSLGLDCCFGGNRDQVSRINSMMGLRTTLPFLFEIILDCLWLAIHCAESRVVLQSQINATAENNTSTQLHLKFKWMSSIRVIIGPKHLSVGERIWELWWKTTSI